MRKDPKVFLQHIHESIEEIERNLRHCAKEEFLSTIPLQDAVVRRLEIMGEAVKNLSPSFRKKQSGIRWKDIAGMRDVLIHGYFGVDYDLVWKICKKDVPVLKKQIAGLLKEG